MDNVYELIRARTSRRTYDERPIGSEKMEKLRKYLDTNNKGPFGNEVRFEILELSEMERSEVRQLGTYGVIKGAKQYIVGAVKKADRAEMDFGYCMEKNILFATGLGLGTCWLGGTFRRSNFSQRIGATEDEMVPAVTPVGYAAGRRSFRDSVIRFSAGSKKRKPWSDLFFKNAPDKPLSKEDAGEYERVLESVRLGPSASNRQPWRIIRDEGRNAYHFFIRSNRVYERAFKEFRLQDLDMGIAMCHFELTAKELGLAGKWVVVEPDIKKGGFEYVVSWEGGN